jgi:hypothetical protein
LAAAILDLQLPVAGDSVVVNFIELVDLKNGGWPLEYRFYLV